MVSYNLVYTFGSSLMFFSGTIAEYAGAPVVVAIGGFLVLAMASSVAVYLPQVRQLEE